MAFEYHVEVIGLTERRSQGLISPSDIGMPIRSRWVAPCLTPCGCVIAPDEAELEQPMWQVWRVPDAVG